MIFTINLRVPGQKGVVCDLDCNFASPRKVFTKYALKNKGLLLALNGNPQGSNVALTMPAMPRIVGHQ